MDEKTCDESIMAVEADQRVLLIRDRKAAESRVIGQYEEQIRETIAGDLRAQYAERARELIDSGQFERRSSLRGWYVQALIDQEFWHQKHGCLKPPTTWPQEIKRTAIAVDENAWSRESHTLSQQPEVGESIVEITLDYIRTSTRTLTRDDVRNLIEAARPLGRSKAHWLRENSTPAGRLEEIRDERRRAEAMENRPFRSQAGPGPGPNLWESR